ncbi:DEAD-box ATP-dependent RNA helicase CshA [Pseudolycoriella hygida]|uniref:RNA helicase n=1 Tax=Pseudolycoriella hygida TaxID=35572 RepID=A0A9Q0N7C0_9DIPT|nr:DEAD-box ATP-dependent RNA helicase CshA [Pseudolycoriella hygida]
MIAKNLTIAIAESCTGGLLTSYLTSIEGASKYFAYGFITYSNQAKIDLLNVSPQTIERFGAVSKETAEAMALGGITKADSSIAIAITGIAGPQGGTPQKPVGTFMTENIKFSPTTNSTYEIKANPPIIILVAPQMGENIGAAARAMKNFNISELRIIAPRDGWPNEQARSMAVSAVNIIDNAKIYENLENCIEDIDYLYATSSTSPMRLKERRIMLGISQQELSKVAKVNVKRIQKYEDAVAPIAGSILYPIAKYLRVPPGYFVDITPPTEYEYEAEEDCKFIDDIIAEDDTEYLGPMKLEFDNISTALHREVLLYKIGFIMKSFNLPEEIITSLERMKIISPTEIQKEAIPIAMQGNDILASSQTGSGKTLAYLLPIINSYIKTKTMSLILVPTRELATQVGDTLTKLVSTIKLPTATLIGGQPMYKQFAQLKANPKVVIGTPGRIIDHLVRGSLRLDATQLVVLDEMDRMLDMGMKEQLEEINKYLASKRQVLMFSATMPKHIIELSKKYVVNPTRISVGSSTKAAVQITQETMRVTDKEKFPELIKQLNTRKGSIIIFVKTKRGADQLAKMLKLENHKVAAIHGDLSQGRRERVISLFRSSKHRIMVATDVIARGVDIPHTQHVINYDLPMCPEDYVHRIGRTGRAGATGAALSFISPEDNMRWKAIDRLINYGETTLRKDMPGDKNRKNFKRPFNEHKMSKGKKAYFSRDNNRNNNAKKPYEYRLRAAEK